MLEEKIIKQLEFESYPKTIFCDIDGVLLEHTGDLSSIYSTASIESLTNQTERTINKLIEWDQKGYKIILTTGRRESMRELTVRQLNQNRIFYDLLIMGLPRGARVVINDLKPGIDSPTAIAINIERNKGLVDVSI